VPACLRLIATSILFLSICSNAANDLGINTVPAAATSFRLGKLELVALHDAGYVAANDGKTFGVDVGQAAVASRLKLHGLAEDRIVISVNALLVKSAGHIVLLDTGLGEKLHGGLMQSLKAAGVPAGSITDVLITHSHGDHVGGLISAAASLNFPGAIIRMAAAEWDFMKHQADAAELVKAISARVRTFAPGAEVVPGIRAVVLAGHTPGHVGYEISQDGKQLIDIGDMAHSSLLSLEEPGWTMGFDTDQQVAKATRRDVLTRLAQSRELVFSPHFPFPGVGRIVTAGSGFEWEPAKP
jgi:glyoxylase-like metal-dependent hydrolase (beta-lactamase superfamily II)